MSKTEQLKEALKQQRLLHFDDRFEDGSLLGYVFDVGPVFVLVAIVDDRIKFNGFRCYRIGDLSRIGPHGNAQFVETALRLRGDTMPSKPPVSLASLSELLRYASLAFPLVTIHRQGFDPDCCWIGRVVEITSDCVALLEINPNASWDTDPEYHKLDDITRVDFGGGYEEALYLVGGEPILPALPDDS